MKIKRYKKVKKTMSFYINNFGFREPYQVLVDGNLCFAALNNKVNIANDIPRYLQGEVKLLTTPCTIIEMENLGKKVGGALLVLKQYPLHKCGHSKPVPAVKCLLSMLGKKNDNHYIIATQDTDLQKKMRQIPGVPLLYLHLKTPVLEHPSDASERFVNSNSSAMTEFEKTTVDEMRSRLGIDKDSSDEKPKKKKKLKGPNPLSCLKSKKKSEVQNMPIQKKEGKPETEKKARKKVRVPQHVREELFSKGNT